MNSIKKFLLPIRLLISKMVCKKNWYWPNLKAFINGRIILSAHIPACYQYTMVTGIGKLFLGDKCEFGVIMGGRFRNGSIELQTRSEKARIVIADCVSSNNNVFICAANYIEIGQNTLIGEAVTIMDHEAHGTAPDKRRQLGEIGEVKIGSNVWIGNRVIILKNTEIGNNSIIAAGAVVSGHFPSDVIIGGIPAKVIRHL